MNKKFQQRKEYKHVFEHEKIPGFTYNVIRDKMSYVTVRLAKRTFDNIQCR